MRPGSHSSSTMFRSFRSLLYPPVEPRLDDLSCDPIGPMAGELCVIVLLLHSTTAINYAILLPSFTLLCYIRLKKYERKSVNACCLYWYTLKSPYWLKCTACFALNSFGRLPPLRMPGPCSLIARSCIAGLAPTNIPISTCYWLLYMPPRAECGDLIFVQPVASSLESCANFLLPRTSQLWFAGLWRAHHAWDRCRLSFANASAVFAWTFELSSAFNLTDYIIEIVTGGQRFFKRSWVGKPCRGLQWWSSGHSYTTFQGPIPGQATDGVPCPTGPHLHSWNLLYRAAYCICPMTGAASACW